MIEERLLFSISNSNIKNIKCIFKKIVKEITSIHHWIYFVCHIPNVYNKTWTIEKLTFFSPKLHKITDQSFSLLNDGSVNITDTPDGLRSTQRELLPTDGCSGIQARGIKTNEWMHSCLYEAEMLKIGFILCSKCALWVCI